MSYCNLNTFYFIKHTNKKAFTCSYYIQMDRFICEYIFLHVQHLIIYKNNKYADCFKQGNPVRNPLTTSVKMPFLSVPLEIGSLSIFIANCAERFLTVTQTSL